MFSSATSEARAKERETKKKKKTIWIETRWNEEEIIDTDASKKDNQRIRLGGKCNLPTLSRKKKRRNEGFLPHRHILYIYINTTRPDAAAAGVNSGRERERGAPAERRMRFAQLSSKKCRDQEKLSAIATRCDVQSVDVCVVVGGNDCASLHSLSSVLTGGRRWK
jgi:hypothetical protein